jgi:hypothetical protein
VICKIRTAFSLMPVKSMKECNKTRSLIEREFCYSALSLKFQSSELHRKFLPKKLHGFCSHNHQQFHDYHRVICF